MRKVKKKKPPLRQLKRRFKKITNPNEDVWGHFNTVRGSKLPYLVSGGRKKSKKRKYSSSPGEF
jgi:hypothetical protein